MLTRNQFRAITRINSRKILPYTGNPSARRSTANIPPPNAQAVSEIASKDAKNQRLAHLSLVVSTAGVIAFLLQEHFATEVRADAPITVYKKKNQDDAQRVRKILHGEKELSYNGVDAEHILKRCEQSIRDNSSGGVWRYDINQIASNNPTEDDHAEAVLRSPSGSPWHFWAVIDGHVGWETSRALADRLIPSVGGALRGLYSRNPDPSNDAIDKAIKDTFLTLDDEFVYKAADKALKSTSRSEAALTLSQAFAGAVAMLAFYDQAEKTLKVALTGDLRAVRGRRLADGTWRTDVLTIEQDGANEEEAARIRKEHPGEPDVIKDGRVLGWQPSRMFGDASLKWPVETSKAIHRKHFGTRLRPIVKTPPYVTAEPVITTTDIQDGDFLILGCDGVWESLNSKEAVDLIGSWLEKRGLAKTPQLNQQGSWGSKKSAPAAPGTGEKTVRYEQWSIPKQFVDVDDNAATHLFRNCLGGGDSETMKAVLTRNGSLARRLRDDMTVTVVFFGESPLSE
ncbi:protein serine/threonine phosphatase 2C [Serendipita vermifera]|nr:protein serine/threonine phosphatase 2C [Serendipita vermifera]